MTQEFAENLIVRPTLHHFGIATGNLEAMVDWYAKVVGMVIVHQSARPWESKPDAYLGSAFVSNDTAHHCIAINALPGLKDDTDRYHAKPRRSLTLSSSCLTTLSAPMMPLSILIPIIS